MISCERCSINFVKDSYDIVLIILQYIVLIFLQYIVLSFKRIISISIVLAPTGALFVIMRHLGSGNSLFNFHLAQCNVTAVTLYQGVIILVKIVYH